MSSFRDENRASRYRFAMRPKWIASHVLILLLVVVMVNLGFWQLRRLDDKRTRNAAIEANQSLPTVALGELVQPGDGYDAGSRLAFRTVTVTGRYETGDEVMVRARSQNGQQGVWILTPLRRDDGTAVIVNRGFLPTQGVPDATPSEAAAPAGIVTVTGNVHATQTRGSFGAIDPPDGRLHDLARADIERIAHQVDYPVAPVWVELASSDPAGGAFPEPVPLPVLDEGPHLSYAVQWFIFSTIAIVGYPMILRRSARQEAQRANAPDPTGVEPAQV
jgi:surfeit locus 1 family protein